MRPSNVMVILAATLASNAADGSSGRDSRSEKQSGHSIMADARARAGGKVHTRSLQTMAMRLCDSRKVMDESKQPLFTITLPSSLNFPGLQRAVIRQTETSPAPSTGQPTPQPHPTIPPRDIHLGDNQHPFQLYVKSVYPTSWPYITVKVVLDPTSPYRFHGEYDVNNRWLYGVGAGDSTDVLCERSLPVENQPTTTRTFFIDRVLFDSRAAGKNDYEISYNIMLDFINLDKTPIIIDPKIRNEG